MKIRRIRIKDGYKRFHDLTIDLGDDPKRIIALVGPNGCGKSSVFDAMLYHSNAHHRLGNTAGKDHNYHSMTGASSIDFNAVEMLLNGLTFPEIFRQRRSEGSHSSIFSFRSPYRYNADLKVKAIQATSEIRLNNFGASSCADIDQKMEENYRRLNTFYNKTMHDENLRPSEAKERIIGELNKSISNCLDMTIDNLGNIESGRGTLYFRKDDQPTSFEFNVLSSGEKEVVDIILDLFLRKEDYTDTVFLIDEPELHINTSIQRNLLIEIDRLIGENCQIWVSTHSIGFLRALQTELRDNCSIIEFEKDGNYASATHTLTPMKPNFQAWQKLFSVPLDDLASLVCPKRIIYCEGRDAPGAHGRERGLDAQFFNAIFSSKYPDTQFVSSGGNTELDQRSAIAVSILSKAVQDLDVFVLKDRDAGSGTYMDLTARNEYLDLNEANHRMLLRLEIENYAFDKEVVRAYCVANGVAFDEATYDQHITDIENEDVKDKVGVIKNICNITGSISADRFKLRLAQHLTEEMDLFAELEECIF